MTVRAKIKKLKNESVKRANKIEIKINAAKIHRKILAINYYRAIRAKIKCNDQIDNGWIYIVY
jgi:hypothetical protein